MEKKILVADDEEQIRDIICKYAAFSGYFAEGVGSGDEAVKKCLNGDFDLVIMDVMMPGKDGFTALREIRKTSQIPVIMLSAKTEDYDKITGFESGADDYVPKPFSPKELMCRCAAVLKRAEAGRESSSGNRVYVYEGLRVDIGARAVTVDGKQAELSPKEYDLLFFLVENRGIALSRDTLITKVWGYDYYGDERTLDTHIKLLRKSLGRYQDRIVTLRTVGYRFDG